MLAPQKARFVPKLLAIVLVGSAYCVIYIAKAVDVIVVFTHIFSDKC